MKAIPSGVRTLRTILHVAVAIATLVLLALIVLAAVRFFRTLQREVAAAIVVAASTILVSVLSVVVTKHYDRRQVIEQQIREKKIPVYTAFLEFMFRLFLGGKLAKGTPSEAEAARRFIEFTQELAIWGSDEVIRAWSNLRTAFVTLDASEPKDTPKGMYLLEDLIYAIRRDTGHKNKGLGRSDLLRLWINDWDEHIAKLEAATPADPDTSEPRQKGGFPKLSGNQPKQTPKA